MVFLLLLCVFVGSVAAIVNNSYDVIVYGATPAGVLAADAAAAMRAAATHHGPVVVAGSLYLIGAVREGLMRSGVLPNEGLL